MAVPISGEEGRRPAAKPIFDEKEGRLWCCHNIIPAHSKRNVISDCLWGWMEGGLRCDER